jgi:hypothetical protein
VTKTIHYAAFDVRSHNDRRLLTVTKESFRPFGDIREGGLYTAAKGKEPSIEPKVRRERTRCQVGSLTDRTTTQRLPRFQTWRVYP